MLLSLCVYCSSLTTSQVAGSSPGLWIPNYATIVSEFILSQLFNSASRGQQVSFVLHILAFETLNDLRIILLLFLVSHDHLSIVGHHVFVVLGFLLFLGLQVKHFFAQLLNDVDEVFVLLFQLGVLVEQLRNRGVSIFSSFLYAILQIKVLLLESFNLEILTSIFDELLRRLTLLQRRLRLCLSFCNGSESSF